MLNTNLNKPTKLQFACKQSSNWKNGSRQSIKLLTINNTTLSTKKFLVLCEFFRRKHSKGLQFSVKIYLLIRKSLLQNGFPLHYSSIAARKIFTPNCKARMVGDVTVRTSQLPCVCLSSII